MMQYPLVSVICICYNQEKYVIDALQSVVALDYPNVELIIADDASTDNSQKRIRQWLINRSATTIFNTSNLGNCKTFNKALKKARGAFIVDLAADDMLLPNGLLQAVSCLQTRGEAYGVFFADAQLINEKGSVIRTHKTQSFFKNGEVPQGSIYKWLLSKYFINPVTMVYRKSVLDTLGGYSENLVYEDFDFWIRSSKITKYCYQPVVTVSKRIHPNSLSAIQYSANSKMLWSTLEVCKTAFDLNQTRQEDVALLKRIRYELKMAVQSTNFKVATRLFFLGIKVFFKIR